MLIRRKESLWRQQEMKSFRSSDIGLLSGKINIPLSIYARRSY
jgi:hypothetical protein